MNIFKKIGILFSVLSLSLTSLSSCSKGILIDTPTKLSSEITYTINTFFKYYFSSNFNIFEKILDITIEPERDTFTKVNPKMFYSNNYDKNEIFRRFEVIKILKNDSNIKNIEITVYTSDKKTPDIVNKLPEGVVQVKKDNSSWKISDLDSVENFNNR